MSALKFGTAAGDVPELDGPIGTRGADLGYTIGDIRSEDGGAGGKERRIE